MQQMIDSLAEIVGRFNADNFSSVSVVTSQWDGSSMTAATSDVISTQDGTSSLMQGSNTSSQQML